MGNPKGNSHIQCVHFIYNETVTKFRFIKNSCNIHLSTCANTLTPGTFGGEPDDTAGAVHPLQQHLEFTPRHRLRQDDRCLVLPLHLPPLLHHLDSRADRAPGQRRTCSHRAAHPQTEEDRQRVGKESYRHSSMSSGAGGSSDLQLRLLGVASPLHLLTLQHNLKSSFCTEVSNFSGRNSL